MGLTESLSAHTCRVRRRKLVPSRRSMRYRPYRLNGLYGLYGLSHLLGTLTLGDRAV
ncbi:hypothetical protein BDW67DRAFT_164293, partial [Aspergillus spinulosporus]